MLNTPRHNFIRVMSIASDDEVAFVVLSDWVATTHMQTQAWDPALAEAICCAASGTEGADN